ncbi:SdpI family protein [Staphylococcus debuckii]|uniref:SdpI family protein n=1 Tax=Staphylococcus debuckii TaxID=2044912 RepID=A0ABU9F0K5_9STAP
MKEVEVGTKKFEHFGLAMIILTAATWIIFMSFLPWTIPLHYNNQNQLDLYLNKVTAPIVMILIMIVSYSVIKRKAKRDKHHKKFGNVSFDTAFWNPMVQSFMYLLSILMIFHALGYNIMNHFIGILILSFLLILWGNYLQIVPVNAENMGIRNQRTKASEAVWKRTHRFTSRLFIVVGFLLLILALFRAINNITALLIFALVGGAIPFAYSKYAYQKIEQTKP